MLTDLISRQATIHEIHKQVWLAETAKTFLADALNELPSAEPTLYGYNVRDLDLIARILQEEGLPPERVVEALTDIGRIIAIVLNEVERHLQRTARNGEEDKI